jgi:hypothetical protein
LYGFLVKREKSVRKDFGFFVFISDVRTQKLSSVVLTTGGLSLMVGSLLLSASALSVYRLNQTQDISINAGAWSRVTEAHFGLEKGQEPLGPELSEADIPEHEMVGPPAPIFIARAETPAAAPVVKKGKLVHKAKAGWITKAKSYLKNSKSKLATAHLKTQKTKIVTQVQSLPAQAPQAEMNTLRSLHEMFRGRFLFAITIKPK